MYRCFNFRLCKRVKIRRKGFWGVRIFTICSKHSFPSQYVAPAAQDTNVLEWICDLAYVHVSPWLQLQSDGQLRIFYQIQFIKSYGCFTNEPIFNLP